MSVTALTLQQHENSIQRRNDQLVHTSISVCRKGEWRLVMWNRDSSNERKSTEVHAPLMARSRSRNGRKLVAHQTKSLYINHMRKYKIVSMSHCRGENDIDSVSLMQSNKSIKEICIKLLKDRQSDMIEEGEDLEFSEYCNVSSESMGGFETGEESGMYVIREDDELFELFYYPFTYADWKMTVEQIKRMDELMEAHNGEWEKGFRMNILEEAAERN